MRKLFYAFLICLVMFSCSNDENLLSGDLTLKK